ncbi:BspA family leucine-rich repeat surface protein [Bifidobacterium sp. ESL0790]|uniref:BspA family leucine-rich repeat surface protein n=1 Tax=Bifidobacterium sp. ESL0790 TaxID=2983233 RepID=UPI0023F88A38|nr:BspA family leucine-rich repeat surface protein [Bifidobacterium sp. ESL0790]WEV72233.1 BspA family leucine-rich repeat surface protein [Bifidobacterium sp. ESL0790]
MKSWRTVAIGLLVASAMVAAPAMASASETAQDTSASQSTQAQSSAAPSSTPATATPAPAGAAAGTSAKPDKAGQPTENETKIAQQAPAPKTDQAPSTQSQQPQAQGDPATPKCDTEGDWGGDSAGNNKVHWKFGMEGGDCVLHVGSGIMGQDDAPWDSYQVEGASSLYSGDASIMDGLVFDDGAHTFFADVPETETNVAMNFMPQVRYIKGIAHLNGGKLAPRTRMYQYFEDNPKLESIDLSGWNMSQVTRMDDMFMDDTSLTHIDGLENWDTSNVVSMEQMFQDDSALENLDGISNWNVPKLERITQMFLEAKSIDHLDLSAWRSNVLAGIRYAFYDMAALKSLDVSNWNVAGVDDMYGTFQGDSLLSELKGLDTWNASSALNNMAEMFTNDSALTSVDLSGWDLSGVTHMNELFFGDGSLKTIKGLNKKTGQLADAGQAFFGCESLESLDLTGWDTSALTDMNRMFFDTYALTELKGVGAWDVSNVTNMDTMFYDAKSLKSIDLSHWDTKNVTIMRNMFAEDIALSEIKGVENFNTGNVTNMASMFGMYNGDTGSFTKLDLNSWNTSNVTNMDNMFAGNPDLSEVDLGNWNTEKVTDIGYMFGNCASLSKLNLENWDTRAVTDGDASLPYYLTDIKLGPNTKLQGSYFPVEPTDGIGTEDNGFTGRWTKSDDSWTSTESDGDDESFAAFTQAPGFAGGKFGLQEFIKMTFDNNAPAGVNVTGDTTTLYKAGFDPYTFTLDIPKPQANKMGYTFTTWNTERDGSGLWMAAGTQTYFRKGTYNFYAQWNTPTPIGGGTIAIQPAPPVIPNPLPTPGVNPAPVPGPGPNPGNGGGNGNNNNNNGGGNGGGYSPVSYYNVYRTFTYGATIGAAPNATTPTPAPNSDNNSKSTNKKARPKCMPADVSKRLKAKKANTASATSTGSVNSAAFVTPRDGTQNGVQLTANGWSDSDYIGLPRCAAPSPAPETATATPAATHHFNWWWLLLLVLLVIAIAVCIYVYEKNKDKDGDSQHPDDGTQRIMV